MRIISENNQSTELSYEVYKRIPFSSDRRRMSVLIKDPQDGRIKLLIKGAYNEIMRRTNASCDEALTQAITEFNKQASSVG